MRNECILTFLSCSIYSLVVIETLACWGKLLISASFFLGIFPKEVFFSFSTLGLSKTKSQIRHYSKYATLQIVAHIADKRWRLLLIKVVLQIRKLHHNTAVWNKFYFYQKQPKTSFLIIKVNVEPIFIH